MPRSRSPTRAESSSLSMRKLAEALGVEAMSLYNHIANKDDLLSGIVEAVAGEIAAPSADTEWKTAIREIATSAHESLLRHPWASDLWIRTSPGPARMRYGDSLLGALRRAFSKELTYHAYHILESYVLGYTGQVLNFRARRRETVRGPRRGLHPRGLRRRVPALHRARPAAHGASRRRRQRVRARAGSDPRRSRAASRRGLTSTPRDRAARSRCRASGSQGAC